jgi:TDG/mug DNA glycosylase family protein
VRALESLGFTQTNAYEFELRLDYVTTCRRLGDEHNGGHANSEPRTVAVVDGDGADGWPMKPEMLPDYLAHGLAAIFVGTAAGDTSARRGHYYAGPGNEFWQFLADARLTQELLGPDRDAEILAHGFGLTDIAKHRSGNDDVLATGDFDVPAFVAKVEHFGPAWVAFTSKGAAEVVSRALGHGRSVSLGRQRWTIAGVRVFVLPSPSGSNRNPAFLEGKPTRVDWFHALRRSIAVDRPQEGDAP